MGKVNNIHDKFVKESFSHPARAAASLGAMLPAGVVERLDLSKLVVLKESYIDGQMGEHFSDLVFEVPLRDTEHVKADVVLLFEHKSAQDKHVMIQIGNYMFSHYQKAIQQKRTLKLT